MNKDFIQLADGAGGKEMSELVSFIRRQLPFTGGWSNTGDDGASYKLQATSYRSQAVSQNLVFTTDSFVVSPLFFPGGDIGKICMCGTINDLVIMGAKPLGISLAIVMEEGFSKKDLQKILQSMNEVSQKTKIPVVTGDTKVVKKGELDKIMITTAGVGLASKVISDSGAQIGDKIIVSGALGEHGATLLAARFGYKTKLKSDSKPLTDELAAVGDYLTSAKDITRGGLAAIANEMATKAKVKIILDEEKIPIKKEVRTICGLLGLEPFSIASEGRFICTIKEKDALKVLKILKKFNKDAVIVGIVAKLDSRSNKGFVVLKTQTGERILEEPVGVLVPRIC